MKGNNYRYTLCWDCKNACCGCDWSESLIPVKGWEAIPTFVGHEASYNVISCPEFVRDAVNGGQKRYKGDDFACWTGEE